MKRKFLSVVLGLILLFFLNVVLAPFETAKRELNKGSYILTLSYILSGIVTGYIVRNKGWFYGGLVGIIPYLLLVIGFPLFVLFAINSSTNFNGGLTIQHPNIENGAITAYLNIMIIAAILSALGGFIGERIYKRSKSKSVK